MNRFHIAWVALAWLVAISITSFLVLALAAMGLSGATAEEESMGVALAVALGFLVAGFFLGWRSGRAPILYGVALGLFSLVAWFILNLVLGEPTGATTWRSLDFRTLFGIIGLQMAAAVVGARIAVRLGRVRR
jgi:hypothetical protein